MDWTERLRKFDEEQARKLAAEQQAAAEQAAEQAAEMNAEKQDAQQLFDKPGLYLHHARYCHDAIMETLGLSCRVKFDIRPNTIYTVNRKKRDILF